MVFGLFGSKVDRLRKQVREPYSQHENRKEAMIKLLNLGTPEAYEALLSRFGVNASSVHYDEVEKDWLADRVIERGDDEDMIAALRQVILNEERLSKALEAAEKTMKRADYETLIMSALERRVDDHRAGDAKVDLLGAFRQLGGEAARRAGILALNDRNDDVILEGIDLLENAAGEETHETLWNLFHDPYQAPRILRRVGLCLANLAITDPQAREGIPDALHDDFKFESGRLIALRTRTQPVAH
ncbi:MAG TPA: hypothetical protein DEB46_14065 [Myxococcales bacterium]|nr:hypothetical protein [Myxococcales bacterium]